MVSCCTGRVVFNNRDGSVTIENARSPDDLTGEYSELSSTFVDEYSDVSNETMKLAATIAYDAQLGRQSDEIGNQMSLRYHAAYYNTIICYLYYLILVLNLCLALIEKPSDLPLPSVPLWGITIIEIFTLTCFLLRCLHPLMFTECKHFWSRYKNVVTVALLAFTAFDILIYVAMTASPLQKGLRLSRALRPLFLICFSETRQIRRAFHIIAQTLADVVIILILLIVSTIIFARVAINLFSSRHLLYQDGSDYFKSFPDSLFDLYILTTTANFPDIMMPAFDKSRWYAIFFIAVVCFGAIFVNAILARIYQNYKQRLCVEMDMLILAKKEKLNRIFDLLMVSVCDKMMITRKRFTALLKNVPPGRSEILINILWYVLDDNATDAIDRDDFLKLADLLNVKISKITDYKIYLEIMCPCVYNSRPSKFIRNCVQHRFFSYIFCAVTVLNVIFIIGNCDIYVDQIFLLLFIAEILLKMYTFGFHRFFTQCWTIFDFTLISTAAALTFIIQSSTTIGVNESILNALLMVRILRAIKIIASLNRIREIVESLIRVLPFILIYGGVMFVFYYFYAIVGMELFHGLISYHGYGNNTATENLFCGNSKLNGTEFYRGHYCSNNFNNIINSMVVLFELTVVNQWHVLTAGYVAVTNKWVRIYFVSFHVLCVVFIINVAVSSVLEAFHLQINSIKNDMETIVEQKLQEIGIAEYNPDLFESCVDGNTNDITKNILEPMLKHPLQNLTSGKNIRFRVEKTTSAQICFG